MKQGQIHRPESFNSRDADSPVANFGKPHASDNELSSVSQEELNLLFRNVNQLTSAWTPEIQQFLQAVGNLPEILKSVGSPNEPVNQTRLDRRSIGQTVCSKARGVEDVPFIRASSRRSRPRILVVTPEITRLPQGMSDLGEQIHAKAGGLADMLASLVSELYKRGADIHVALPNYRRLFKVNVTCLGAAKRRRYQSELANAGIHLAEDRVFHHRNKVYDSDDNIDISLAFQREVINNIIPRVQPDIIHCNDWMTGLIPAAANKLGIPTLFTIHNIHTRKITLGDLEMRGIDPVEFWDRLYYEHRPSDYWQAFEGNCLDMLTSGIFAADAISVVSPSFLNEIVEGVHDVIPHSVQSEVAAKKHSGHAFGVINAPDPSFDPLIDQSLVMNYGPTTALKKKATNKLAFQNRLGLECGPDFPVCFWPSRLDPRQKGCHLLTDILCDVVSAYGNEGLQIAVIADGPFQKHFHAIVDHHDLGRRVAVCDFNDDLSHMGYAAADFLLMPSQFEPCGLSQMIGCLYGTLPIVHNTGGLHDTVQHLDVKAQTGNGFVFDVFDSQGLRWAIDRAMDFHRLDAPARAVQIARVMEEGSSVFNYRANATSYIDLYEGVLGESVIS